MKKVLIFCLAIILVVIAFIVINNNDSEQLDDTNSVSENSTESEDEVSNETETSYENDGTFVVTEVDGDDYDLYYTIVETDEEYAESFDFIIENNEELTITFYDTELNEYLIEDSDVIEYNTEYTVINSGDIEYIFVGEVGQDLNYPLVLLLQTDGTVKAIDMRDGYLTGEFIAKDLTELENIESFEQVSISYPEDSGYYGVVAISEDGLIYEISGYIVE